MTDEPDLAAAEPARPEPPRATGELRDVASHPDYAAAIYGSLLVTSLVAVQWRHDAVADGIAISIVVTVVIFWLAHAWSEIVNRRVHGPIQAAEARAIAAREVPMLLATVLPALVLALGRLPGVSIDAAIAAALIVSIGQLFVWGLVVGRAAHSSWWLAIRVAVIDSLLGVVIVGLKVAVLH